MLSDEFSVNECWTLLSDNTLFPWTSFLNYFI